ncbi:lipid II:glycine glycyltransferase FemX [Neomicrococcus aestuarii]|uniref:FemAB family protein n=1 Tax=Neomicrococcus aestuarii TaxID=556325 RepID=A0A1L2ZNT9_9MICC|nr:peptidoglycan bridge formation glycyltransferase FemA/FemB family protein [Neomicrococcus aestuarii]APF41073.1 FemAB family protein [Neomicrococcus aestuarii]
MSASSVSVRPITASEHRAHLEQHPRSSFLQLPAWAEVKKEWRAEYLGWFRDSALVGSTLVLHRPVPVVKYTLAYLPEGPVFDWENEDFKEFLKPMVSHFKKNRVFMVKMGAPLIRRSWKAADVRKALSQGSAALISELPEAFASPRADFVAASLRATGWRKEEAGEDFTVGQPEFQARIPLVDDDGAQLDVDGVLGQMNQNARRETRKAASGPLDVTVGSHDDIARFHTLYRETAERDGFTGRPQSYFENMFAALNDHKPGTCTVYIASHEGVDLAAAIRVHSGEGAWYVYGASSAVERKLFAPKALMHRMITDSVAEGCAFLDQGGVSATLSKEHHLAGLTLFKTTLGCDVVQTLGEWDLTLNKVFTTAYELYMKRRGK